MTREYTINPYKKLRLIILNNRRNWKNNINDYMLYSVIMNESDEDIHKTMLFFHQKPEVEETIKMVRDAFYVERKKFENAMWQWKRKRKKENEQTED